MRLESLELWLAPLPGPVLPRVRRALADAAGVHGEPLRWAITAVDPERGFCIEAVLVVAGPDAS